MIEVTKITVVETRYGPDDILLETTLPPAGYPWNAAADLKLSAAAGTGADYCAANFPGVPVEIIRVPREPFRFNAVGAKTGRYKPGPQPMNHPVQPNGPVIVSFPGGNDAA